MYTTNVHVNLFYVFCSFRACRVYQWQHNGSMVFTVNVVQGQGSAMLIGKVSRSYLEGSLYEGNFFEAISPSKFVTFVT